MDHVPVAAFYHLILKENLEGLDVTLCLHTFPQRGAKHIKEVNLNTAI